MPAPRTLFEKVWEQHILAEPDGEPTLIYIDLHLVHEDTSPRAFDGLRMTGRKLRRPDRHLATGGSEWGQVNCWPSQGSLYAAPLLPFPF